jgi:peptide/nickel transport system substrate-binding protein
VLGDDGLVPITTQFFSEDSPWYSDEVAQAYPGGAGRDVEAAIELVEAYRNDPDRSDGRAPGDPIEVTYNCPPDPSLVEIGQLLQQLWGEVGVEVRLENVEQATHIGNALGSADQDPPWSGTYMINCWRAGVESDPLTTFQGFYGPPEESPLNFTNFSLPEIDELLEVLKTESDFATRYEAVEQIGLLTAEWVPLTWGVGTASYVGWRDDIHGIATWRLPSGKDGSGTYEGRVILHQAWMDQG